MSPEENDKTDETPEVEAEKPKRRRRRAQPAEESAAAAPSSEVAGADLESEDAASSEETRATSAEEAAPPDSGADEADDAASDADVDPQAEEEAEEPDAEAEGEEPAAEAAPQNRRARRRSRASGGAEAAPAPKPAPARRRRAQRDPNLPPPVVRAHAKYVRTSPRKARLVCDHIRGKSVEEARAILAYTPRAVARDWSKLLESAVANAEHNHELVGEDLYIKAVHADDGPTIKRFQPRAMGRATKIRKRTSHLTILLTPKD
jgi:ribosomal protein L22